MSGAASDSAVEGSRPEPAPPRVSLAVPSVGQAEAEAVAEAIGGGWVAGVGPILAAFERDLASRFSTEHAVAASSGTAALHLALAAVGVKAGDAVLVPSLTFVATANAVRYLGAVPIFLDVEPEFGLLDVGRLRHFLFRESWILGGVCRHRATGRRIRAILPVDLLGHPVDMDVITEIAREHGLAVVEDAAEAAGATYKGRAAGSLAEVGVLSFNGNKIITAGGGGAVLTHSAAFAERARFLATQARSDAVESRHAEVGFNYRLSSVQAAIGRAQLMKLDGFLDQKRRIHDRYAAELSDLPGLGFFAEASWARSSFWLTCVRIDPGRFGVSSRELMKRLEERNIESRPFWEPLHRSKAHAGAAADDIRVADELWEQCLCLPSSVAVTDEEQGRVIGAIRSAR